MRVSKDDRTTTDNTRDDGQVLSDLWEGEIAATRISSLADDERLSGEDLRLLLIVPVPDEPVSWLLESTCQTPAEIALHPVSRASAGGEVL